MWVSGTGGGGGVGTRVVGYGDMVRTLVVHRGTGPGPCLY